jgi:hypothetical protein
MKMNILPVKISGMTAAFGAVVLVGCADYVGVGYNDAYYIPDYTPFYADYYYDGVPYWGPNFTYVKKKIVVHDVNRHINVNRNLYYGGHHFMGASYWHGSRSGVRAGGFHPAVRTGGFGRVRR